MHKVCLCFEQIQSHRFVCRFLCRRKTGKKSHRFVCRFLGRRKTGKKVIGL